MSTEHPTGGPAVSSTDPAELRHAARRAALSRLQRAGAVVEDLVDVAELDDDATLQLRAATDGLAAATDLLGRVGWTAAEDDPDGQAAVDDLLAGDDELGVFLRQALDVRPASDNDAARQEAEWRRAWEFVSDGASEGLYKLSDDHPRRHELVALEERALELAAGGATEAAARAVQPPGQIYRLDDLERAVDDVAAALDWEVVTAVLVADTIRSRTAKRAAKRSGLAARWDDWAADLEAWAARGPAAGGPHRG